MSTKRHSSSSMEAELLQSSFPSVPSAQVTEASPQAMTDSVVANPLNVSYLVQESLVHGPDFFTRHCLHHLFEAQVAQTPDAIAIVHQGQTLTYAALNQRANQLAHALLDLGVGPDRLVAISLERSLEMMVAFLGVLKAGGAYVPIDPDYPESRRQYILTDAETNIILTQSSLATEMANDAVTLICLDTDWPRLAQQPTHNPDVAMSPEHLAYVIYTSGSTGNPKGVMAHHRGVVNYSLAMAEALELNGCDRMLQFSTMSFDFIVSEIYPTLVAGGAVVLRSDEMVTSIKAFLDFLAQEEITVIQFTTAFWHELVGGIERLQATLPPSLRLVLFGGEKASRAICRQWFDLIGDYPRLFNAYGPTEATVITTIYDTLAEGYDCTYDLPIGRPLRNLQTYILDENLQPVLPGEPGELYIGGPGVTRGYMNLPEKTAKAFVSSPFSPQERLYRTGDIVRMDAGGPIEFVGRVDFQVKIRGFRIELGEIESCLDQYEPIHQRIVLAREDTPGDKRLVAYLVMKPGQTLDRQNLQQFLKEHLPHFMVPSAIMVLETLPKTPNGKIDRAALPIPSLITDPQRSIVAPRTELEKQLVDVWQSVLEVEPIGITDNFFELGGHSLLVLRLFSQLEVTFNRRLPLIDIFTAPTIEQLAALLEHTVATHPLATLTVLRMGEVEPPLFLVHDVDGDTSLYLNLARKLSQNRTVYGLKPLTSEGLPMIHTHITDMAAHCVKQMRQVQPEGPYLLGGLCAGGVVAFETALQLEGSGEQVALLALMDSPDPEAQQKAGRISQQRLNRFGQSWQTETQWFQRIQTIWNKGKNLLSYELSTRYHQWQTYWKSYTLQWFTAQHWSPPPFLQGISVRELFLFAYARYIPSGVLDAQTLLFRATQGNGTDADTPYLQIYEDPLFGWGRRTRQTIQTFDVPGGHSTMLNDANALGIATALETAIETALKDTPTL